MDNLSSIKDGYKCVICRTNYPTQSELDQHAKNTHGVNCISSFQYIDDQRESICETSVKACLKTACMSCGPSIITGTNIKCTECRYEPYIEHSIFTSSSKSENNTYKNESNLPNIKPEKVVISPKALKKKHIEIDSRKKGNKEYKHQCEYCQKTFLITENYQKHIRVHTKEKPYTCEYCLKSFSQSSTLKQHTRQHTGERPYVCDECGRGFSVRDYLNKHMRTHTGEKPYECKLCGKKYSQISPLKIHQKNHC